MKTIRNIAVLLLSFFILCSFSGKKAKNDKEGDKLSEHTNVALDMIGYIENSGYDLKNASYRLYRDSRFVGGGSTDRFGTIEIRLMRNSHYFLEFSSPGFISKRIYISTFLPDNLRNVFDFSFGVSLIPQEFFTESDLCSLEVPYAFVFYSEEKKAFGYDIKYTEKIIKLEEQVISSMFAL